MLFQYSYISMTVVLFNDQTLIYSRNDFLYILVISLTIDSYELQLKLYF